MLDYKKYKLAIIVGTRPEIIRLSQVIKNCSDYFDRFLIHTGQNYDYELNKIFFKDLNIKEPDVYLNCASSTAVGTISNVLKKTESILKKIKPDALLILGDTNSSLSSIVAKKNKIPIFHYEAGNRCFDQRVPEEINRKIVDHISDINFTYSGFAKNNLIKEGINQQDVINIGSPMFEILKFYKTKINKSKILKKLNIKKNKYFVLSLHREENVDDKNKIFKYVEAFNYIADNFKIPIIFTTHPRTKKNIDLRKLKLSKNIYAIKPINFTDYVHLQKNSKLVFSDSGTISEESSILNFRAINIRDSHERQESLQEGAVMFTGPNINKLVNYINIILKEKRDKYKIVNDYNIDFVSYKILRLILTHIDTINKTIWKK